MNVSSVKSECMVRIAVGSTLVVSTGQQPTDLGICQQLGEKKCMYENKLIILCTNEEKTCVYMGGDDSNIPKRKPTTENPFPISLPPETDSAL